MPNATSTLNCTTSSNTCGGYTPISINEYCTDFSILTDSSSGQISTIENITAGAQFCVAFSGGSWIGLQSTNCGWGGRKKRYYNSGRTSSGSTRTTVSTTTVAGCYSTTADWSIGCCIDLTVRPDGFINTPPVATIISPITIPINTITNITIPVIDADDDYLSCRWAQKTAALDECGDVCQMAPGSTLDNDDCVLTYNSTGKTVGQYYAVTLMVEDYYDSSTPTPFSSVPVQFLIHIVSATACPLQPTISSNLSDCSPIQVGVQFTFTLTIVQGCPGTTLQDVYTMPPLYMYKGSITQVGSTSVWTVTETWVPDELQLGSQVYCAVATDSDNIQSDQYCLTFMVVPDGQVPLCPGDVAPTTSTTTTSTSTTTTSTTSTTSVTTSTTTSTATTSTSTSSTSPTSTSTSTTSTDTSTTSTTSSSTSATSTSTSSTSTTSSSTSTSSTSTSTTSTTSTSTTTSTTSTTTTTTTTTSTTTTTVTTTKSPSHDINIPLIVGLSLLALLASLLCCCCLCWWLWGGGARRRRQNRTSGKEQVKQKFSFTKKCLKLMGLKQRKNNIPYAVNSTRSSRITTTSMAKSLPDSDINCNSLNTIYSKSLPKSYENIALEPQAKSRVSGVSVIHVSRVDRSLTNQENEVMKSPISDDNNISGIDLLEPSIHETPRVSIIKLPRARSSAPTGRIIKVSKAESSTERHTNVTTELSKKSKDIGSVIVSKVNRRSSDIPSSKKGRTSTAVSVIKLKLPRSSSKVSADLSAGFRGSFTQADSKAAKTIF
ncbi:unnamed protein product [Adineta steineri]|uniref:Uncharacterized protein n=1 Tax=Adineta steineri TaxID=433720 RepID=A0A818HYK3_9BILA|nr:unnamed protein product [Adineta steineri]